MPLFLMGCFPVDFQEIKRPLRTKSWKHPIKAGKRPIKEGKRPIKAMVLVSISVGCLMGCFRAPPPWRKTAPLKRPIKRSMTSEGRKWGVRSVVVEFGVFGAPQFSVHKSQNPLKEVFGDLWTENWGAPKTPNPTTTDLTPHLRPSDTLTTHTPLIKGVEVHPLN